MIQLFLRGGPIMWPLLLTSIVALGTVIERAIFRVLERTRRDQPTVEKIFNAIEKGDYEAAIRAGANCRDYRAQTIIYALGHRERSLSAAFLQAANRELQRFNRGLPVLDTIITLAPLLGLLGTVTGLIRAFGMLGTSEVGSPVAITGGIAEALIATAFGLSIAIVALIPFNFLNSRMEEARNEIQDTGTYLELLLAKQFGDILGGGETMNIPSPNSRRRARIEIIPLIDIMFFLLATFLMVSLSMVKNIGIQVNIPTAKSSVPQDLKDYATISVTAAGDVFWNKEHIETKNLEAYLKALKESYAEPKVFIQGDDKAFFGTIVEVLDQVRQRGITKVSIQTKRETPAAKLNN